ncbi:hypothetical protein [Mycolicibacter sinensis]
MTLSNGWPSLSEVRAASWDYLKASGESWSRLADTWENAFAEVRNASVRPGGTVWDGRAAHRMQERTAADAVTVRTPADQLRLAAEIARRCCGRQETNKQSVLNAVNAAVHDGFNVGDDYTLTDTRPCYSSTTERDAREHAADGHAGAIRTRLNNLVDAEAGIARDLATATAGLEHLSLPEAGADGGAGVAALATPVDNRPRTAPETEPHGSTAGEAPGYAPALKDVLIASEGAIAGGTADGVRQTVLDVVAKGPTTGPGAPDPGLLKWFKDPEIGGVELRGFSRVARVTGAASAVPAVMSDIQDGNSVAEAVTREGAGVAAGLWVGAQAGGLAGSIVPGAGTAVGVVVGAIAGAGAAMLASNGVEMAWGPVTDSVGSVARGAKSLFGFG